MTREFLIKRIIELLPIANIGLLKMIYYALFNASP